MEIGEYLKKIRKEKKITLKELSKKTGNKYSYSYLSQIENGLDGRKPSREMIAVLSEALDHDYFDLMNEAGYLDTRLAEEIIEEVEQHYDINFPDLSELNMKYRSLTDIVTRIYADLSLELMKSNDIEKSKDILIKYKEILEHFLDNNDLYEILTSSETVRYAGKELTKKQRAIILNVIKAIL